MDIFFKDICNSIKNQTDSLIRESKLTHATLELIYGHCLKSSNVYFIEPPEYQKYKTLYAIRQSNFMVYIRNSDYRLPIDINPYHYIAVEIEYQFPIKLFKDRNYHFFNNSIAPKFPHFVYINPKTFNVCLTDYIEGTNIVLFNIVDYIDYLGFEIPPKDWLEKYLKNKPFNSRLELLINELLDTLKRKEMKERISIVMGEQKEDINYRYKTRLTILYSLYQCYFQLSILCTDSANRYWFVNSYNYLPILLIHPEHSLYTDGLTSLYTYYTMMRTIGTHKEFSQFLQNKEKSQKDIIHFTKNNTEVLKKLSPYLNSFVDNCKLLSIGDIIEITCPKREELTESLTIGRLTYPDLSYTIFNRLNNFRFYDE